MNKHTKGPWTWQSFDGGKSIFLGTPDRGRMVVMDFCRQGMNGAQPRFAVREENMGGRMVKFEDWKDLSESADARLIAASPDLLSAGKKLSALANTIFVKMTDGEAEAMANVFAELDSAIAKAETIS